MVVAGIAGCSATKDKEFNEKMAKDGEAIIGSMNINNSFEDFVAVSVEATVKDIDPATRMITLSAQDGKEYKFRAEESVKRFNEIKKGDVVVVDYFESLTLELREPTAAEKMNPTTVFEGAERQPANLPPGVGGIRTINTIVKVIDIDQEANTVTIVGPEGREVTVKARHPERLKKLTIGETIAVSYTEAVAVSIQPRKGAL